MTDGMTGVWTTLTGAVPGVDTEPGPDAATYTPRRRLAACVAAWPGAETGGYDPRCCRFPKSCSADVYDDDRVTDTDLEAYVITDIRLYELSVDMQPGVHPGTGIQSVSEVQE